MAEVPEWALVDTNILVYAHDPADTVKHEQAVVLIKSLSDSGTLAYTTQVLNEFCAVMMRPKRPDPITPAEAKEIIADLSATGQVFPLSAHTTILSLQAMIDYGMFFWDALVWATAKEHGVGIIYTEDQQAMATIGGVLYVNPFDGSR